MYHTQAEVPLGISNGNFSLHAAIVGWKQRIISSQEKLRQNMSSQEFQDYYAHTGSYFHLGFNFPEQCFSHSAPKTNKQQNSSQAMVEHVQRQDMCDRKEM